MISSTIQYLIKPIAFLMLLLLLFLSSCVEDNPKTVSRTVCSQRSNAIKCETFNQKGQVIKSYMLNSDSILHGDYFEYYQDGSLKLEGKYFEGQRLNTFKHYDVEGWLKELEIYKYSLVTYEVELNQYISLNAHGDTNYKGSYFLRFDFDDSLFVEDTIKIRIRLHGSKFEQRIRAYAGLFKEGSEELYSEGLARFLGNKSSIQLQFDPKQEPGSYILEGFLEDIDFKSMSIGSDGDTLYDGRHLHLGHRFYIHER